MIPNKIGTIEPVGVVAFFGKGFETMAVKKSKEETKGKDVPTSTKAGAKASAAKQETAPQQTKSANSKTEPGAAKAAPKQAAAKKADAPAKLSAAQSELLKKIGGAPEPGYLSEKKAELRTIEVLQEKKLIKRGSKDKTSGNYRYLISSAGKKHLDAQAAAPGGNSPQPASSQPAPPPPTSG